MALTGFEARMAARLRYFVWTETGKTVHISLLYAEHGLCGQWTLCGREWTEVADAALVLWFPLCRKCRASADKENECGWTEPRAAG